MGYGCFGTAASDGVSAAGHMAVVVARGNVVGALAGFPKAAASAAGVCSAIARPASKPEDILQLSRRRLYQPLVSGPSPQQRQVLSNRLVTAASFRVGPLHQPERIGAQLGTQAEGVRNRR